VSGGTVSQDVEPWMTECLPEGIALSQHQLVRRARVSRRRSLRSAAHNFPHLSMVEQPAVRPSPRRSTAAAAAAAAATGSAVHRSVTAQAPRGTTAAGDVAALGTDASTSSTAAETARRGRRRGAPRK
jgi:hypothetical protein